MKRAVFLVVVSAMMLLALGCGESSTSTSGSALSTVAPNVETTIDSSGVTVGKVGMTFKGKNLAITVKSAERKSKLAEYVVSKQGEIFMLVEVSIENAGGAKESVIPSAFKLKDGVGKEYQVTFSGIQNALDTGTLAPGEKAKGYLEYRVSTESKSLDLLYSTTTDSKGFRCELE